MAIPTPSTYVSPLNTGDTALVGGTSPTTMVIRHFPDFQKILSPKETPLSSSIGTGKEVNAKKIEWGTSFYAPNQVTLGAAVAAVGTTTITLAAGEGLKVMNTSLIEIGGSEIVWVTSHASADVLNVIRGMGTTTAAAWTLNDASGAPRTLEVLASAAQENADTPLGPVTRGGTEFNYPQLIDEAIHVSNREDVTPDYEYNGNGSKYDTYLKKKMIETAIKFEKSLVRGVRGVEDAMTVGAGRPTMMGGLRFFTDNNYDLSGAPLDENTFLDALQRSWERVGAENTPDTVFTGPFGKRAISSLWNSNRYSTVKDTKTTLVWDSVNTDFGSIKFTLSRYIPAGELYLLDISDIKKHAYKGQSWKEVILPSNGPYKRGRFTGDYTSTWPGNQKRQRVSNFSTLASAYPGM